MLTLPLAKRQIVGPLCLFGLCIMAALLPEYWQAWLVYRQQTVVPEVWRLLSANLLHTNLYHLLLNSAGIALLWALHGQYYRPLGYFLLVMFCSLGTTLGIYLGDPGLLWYVGLSGTLHGMFVWGALTDIRCGENTGYLLLVGLIGKIGWEQWQGPDSHLVTFIEANVAIDAHLYGALAGALWFFITFAGKKKGQLSRPE